MNYLGTDPSSVVRRSAGWCRRGLQQFLYELEMLCCISSPTKRVTFGCVIGATPISKSHHREPRRAAWRNFSEIACWNNSNQTRQARQVRKIFASRAIGAYEWESARESLALYDGKTFLTGRKHKNMGLPVELSKLPLRNRIFVNESRVIRKRSVQQCSHMEQAQLPLGLVLLQ